MGIIAVKSAEHGVCGCGMVINNFGKELFQSARKNHVVCVQDENVRSPGCFETDVACVFLTINPLSIALPHDSENFRGLRCIHESRGLPAGQRTFSIRSSNHV